MGFGQSNLEKFNRILKTNDTAKLNDFLIQWEKTGINDPDLYTSCINYYYKKSKQDIAYLNKKQEGNSSLRITDSTGTIAGYLNFNRELNPSYLDSVLVYANGGINRFPRRLDIRFGKIFILGEIGDYNHFTQEIIRTIDYSITIKNDWLWSDNKKLENPENFMLSTVQSYLKQLYDTDDDHLLENIIKIGDTVLKHYPNNIEILSTTAVANLLTKHFDKAIAYLKRAEQLDPKDFIVLNNIAKAYDMTGDKSQAINYYELTEKYGDAEAKEHAKKEIKKLKSE
jgi:tetratricopeptide (TPR) repeat protein